MPKRKHYKRRKLKVKLKKETVYNIFAFGLVLFGLLLFLSFSRSQESFALLADMLDRYFGLLGYIFPLVLILFGFLFFRLKLFISRPNVAIGFLLSFLSLLSLSKSGMLGLSIFQTLQEIITPIGANLVFIAGLFIGIIVLFDTSVDEIVGAVMFLGENSNRIVPSGFISFFKKKNSFGNMQKQITIKGGQKDVAVSNKAAYPPVANKKEGALSEKLISNPVSGENIGIWQYPPLSMLSEMPGQKADRGDVKKIASIIEKTLQSFGVEARVAEINLGPAVTQYALEIALGTKVSKITSLANDLALATEAPTGQIRIEAPIPGRNLVGIEIPNRSLEVVTLKAIRHGMFALIRPVITFTDGLWVAITK